MWHARLARPARRMRTRTKLLRFHYQRRTIFEKSFNIIIISFKTFINKNKIYFFKVKYINKTNNNNQSIYKPDAILLQLSPNDVFSSHSWQSLRRPTDESCANSTLRRYILHPIHQYINHTHIHTHIYIYIITINMFCLPSASSFLAASKHNSTPRENEINVISVPSRSICAYHHTSCSMLTMIQI